MASNRSFGSVGFKCFDRQEYWEAEQNFRQEVDEQEKALGKEDADTLESKHWLATSLYLQRKYAEAEKIFQQTAQKREKVLGKKDTDTLWSKHWLAMSLCKQGKYAEAEKISQQTAQGYEEILGKENVKTLKSKHWLAISLSEQEKYTEAEELFQQVAQRREKVLGKEHVDTALSKYWLARSLCSQERYFEAEELFRQNMRIKVKLLGEEHAYTLFSKHWLARSLQEQAKYHEAEELLRQVVHTRKEVLGQEHVDTFNSTYWLARSLFVQGKYSEAGQVIQCVVQGEGKIFGPEHNKTRESKHWLAAILSKQERYTEAEQLLQQIIQGEERVLGAEHQDTIDSRGSNAKYSDLEISQISSLLSHSHPSWSKVPRTYIVLRIVGCLDLLDQFIDLGFSDYWFPVTERSLPGCLRPSHRSQFVAAQDQVLTKSIGLEKGDAGQHCHFRRDEALPFEGRGVLGSGGFGQVDRVLSLVSFKEYARKRVSRRQAFGGRGTEEMKLFVAEIAILKRLKHRHMVELLGSYTDPKYVGLIMSPIADMDLSTYFAQADATRHAELRTFFGCLARGLEFLHEQNIRHKDIKPGNILVYSGNVLFTDFGLSVDFTNADGSTTCSMVNGMTPRYCAPEVALFEPRNTASDIWSLGVVFLEMAAVLKGQAVDSVPEFLKRHGSKQAFVRTNPTALPELIAVLQASGQASDDRALEWPRQMLQTEQQLRPTAATLTASIIAAGTSADGNGTFCGICCTSLDDDFSDASDLF
ncbi:MAG: hypothetical protein Q9164_003986 [Protoblastenia rupestris]